MYETDFPLTQHECSSASEHGVNSGFINNSDIKEATTMPEAKEGDPDVKDVYDMVL